MSFWRYMLEHRGRWLAPMQGYFHGDRKHRTILVASDDAIQHRPRELILPNAKSGIKNALAHRGVYLI